LEELVLDRRKTSTSHTLPLKIGVQKITETLRVQREEKHLEHAACLVQQGVWSHWDNVMPFDLSWKNLIYGPGPRIISFILNAQINSVRTPDMMKLWGYPQCMLCLMWSGEVHPPPYTRQLQICSRSRSIYLETRFRADEHRDITEESYFHHEQSQEARLPC
jgi:hypothetical protein